MISDGVVTSCRSAKMAATALQLADFRFGDTSHLKMSKTICIPNFGKVAQSAAEILLFSVSENKRPPYWNSTFGSTLAFSSSSVCDSLSTHQILSKSDHWRPS